VKSTAHPKVSRISNPGYFRDSERGIRRHYTEAFCMREEVYKNLIKLSETHDNEEAMTVVK
jgi:hypothetical protein